MRSIKLIAAIIFISVFAANAQDTPPGPKKNFGQRLVFGGGFGAQFGSVTQVNISPIIGYRVTEKLTAGIGITYIYYKYQYLGYNGAIFNEQDHIIGGSLWGEYRVIPQAFLHAEYGILNESIPKQSANGQYLGETMRYNLNSFLVGGGYYQAMGQNAGMQFSLLWDLIEDPWSPYSNPIIRIGFAAGF